MSPEPSIDDSALMSRRHGKPNWAKSRRELRREASRFHPQRQLWPWAAVAALALVLAGVVFAPTSAPPALTANIPSDTATLLHPRDVITVESHMLSQTLPVSGTLRPHLQVEIASRTSGTVENVGAGLGERVSRGDLLLQIDSEGLRAQLRQQQAALEASRAQSWLAEAQSQRSQQLSNRGLTSATNLETSRSHLEVQAANLEMQQAAVAAAEIVLRDARITAPFDGIIADRKVDPGQFIANGTAVFELTDLSSMLAAMNVPLAKSVDLSPGQTVRLMVQGLAGQEFLGQIEGIAPIAIEGSRNSLVTVRVDNPDGILRGGMFVSGEIEIGRMPDTIAIPQESLREDASGRHVLKISAGRLIRQAVEIGPIMSGSGLVAVASGLKPSDRIISGPLPELREGIMIHIEEPR